MQYSTAASEEELNAESTRVRLVSVCQISAVQNLPPDASLAINASYYIASKQSEKAIISERCVEKNEYSSIKESVWLWQKDAFRDIKEGYNFLFFHMRKIYDRKMRVSVQKAAKIVHWSK